MCGEYISDICYKWNLIAMLLFFAANVRSKATVQYVLTVDQGPRYYTILSKSILSIIQMSLV